MPVTSSRSHLVPIARIARLAPLALLLAPAPAPAADLSLPQVLQAVVDHYPSLRSAALQVEKARENTAQVEARLGWQLAAQGGVAKDTSFIGGGVKRIDTGASMARMLESGDSLAFTGSIRREDADTPLSPALPNPVTSTDLEVNYRKPLDKGAGFADYQLALSQAEISVLLAQAEQSQLYDQLAAQVADIFLAAVATRGRIDNVKKSLQFTQRLQQFIRGRLSLGIAEDKDSLQITAQFDSQQAQLKALELAWAQQKIGLNRLMGRDWDAELSFGDADPQVPAGDLQQLAGEAKQHSATMQRLQAQLRLADDAISRQLEARKDQLDLVSFFGNRSNLGDSASGNADNSEWIGGVRLEYKHGVEQKGFDAAIRQAHLERDINLQNQRQLIEDLTYDVASLLAEIKAAQASVEAYAVASASQRAQLKEADERYRKGRIDVDRVIQFETQLAAGELAQALQHIELQRRLYKLALLRGEVWREVTLPTFTESNSGSTAGGAP